MAKDKKKNNAEKKEQPKKQASKAKAPNKGGAKSAKGGPVVEKKRGPIGWLFDYLSSVLVELKRVTWPPREKVIYLVGVVIVTLIFFASFTAIVDWTSSQGVVALNSLTHDGEERVDPNEPIQIDLDDFDLGGVIGEDGDAAQDDQDADEDSDANGDDNGETEE